MDATESILVHDDIATLINQSHIECAEADHYVNLWANATILFQSKDILLQMDFAFFTIVMSVVAIIGLIGNTITVCILRRHPVLKSLTPYIVCLSVSDNLYLIFTHFYFIVLFGLKNMVDMSTLCFTVNYYHVYVVPLFIIAYGAGTALTVTMAIVRYVSISRPLLAHTWLTPKIHRRLAISAFVFPVAICILKLSINEVIDCYDTDGNLIFTFSKLNSSKALRIINGASSIIMGFVSTYIPWILLVVMNALLILKLKKTNTNRSRMLASEDNRTTTRVTALLVSITTSFIVLLFPRMVNITLDMIKYGQVKRSMCEMPMEVSVLRMMYACQSLSTINSSINFFWLLHFSTDFRKHFLKLFRCEANSVKRVTEHSSELQHVDTQVSTISASGSLPG